MEQRDVAVWTKCIREETEEIMKQLEEERDSRSDPDYPFNGTANGVFLPLQDPLSLPPPVQNMVRQDERINEAVTPTQGESCKFREYSRESQDPMASIQNLHIQQRQNRCSIDELNQTSSSAPQTP